MELADWLKVAALVALWLTALNVGGKLVAKLDELRAELDRQGTSLAQVGTDLGELLERIAENAAAGDPTDEDIAKARAIADGLAAHGQALDSAAQPSTEPTPEEPPTEEPPA